MKNKLPIVLVILLQVIVFNSVVRAQAKPHSVDYMTGAWQGTIHGKPIEIVLWPDPKHPTIEWQGFFYLPYNDCVMETYVSDNGERHWYNFLKINGGRDDNCERKTKRNTKFEGEGKFAHDSKNNTLSFTIKNTAFERLNHSKSEKIITVNRSVISETMLDFVKEFIHEPLAGPTSTNLVALQTKKRNFEIPLHNQPNKKIASKISSKLKTPPSKLSKKSTTVTQQNSIDHLGIRNLESGKLVYKDGNTSYYLVTTRLTPGSKYRHTAFIAFHDVAENESINSEENIKTKFFNKHLYPLFELDDVGILDVIQIHHYNSRVILNTGSEAKAPTDFEQAILIDSYLEATEGELKGKWFVSSSDGYNSVKDALIDRKIITRNIASYQSHLKSGGTRVEFILNNDKTFTQYTDATKGPFDKLFGAHFLNAIFNGDKKSIEKQNREYISSMISRYKRFFDKPTFMDKSNLTAYKSIRLIDIVSANYLFDYGKRFYKCLKKDAVTVAITKYYPGSVTRNGFGHVISRVAPSSRIFYYKINPEFVDLLQRVSKIETGGLSNIFSGLLMRDGETDLVDQLKLGVQQLFHKACFSAEVKQFETNLIKLSTR